MMEAAARLLVESTEADLRACQLALDALQRQQRELPADRSVPQQPVPALGEYPPCAIIDTESRYHDSMSKPISSLQPSA